MNAFLRRLLQQMGRLVGKSIDGRRRRRRHQQVGWRLHHLAARRRGG